MIDLDDIHKRIEGSSEDARFTAWTELYLSKESGALEEIKRILLSHDPVLKLMFLRFLTSVGDSRSASFITQLLLDSNIVVADAAKRAFEGSRFENKLENLLPLVDSQVIFARDYAIEKLALGGQILIIDPLILFMQTANDDFLKKILMALRFLPDRRLLKVTRKYLTDARDDIRYAALLVYSSLYELGLKKTHGALLAALSDPLARIRQAALWALRPLAAKKDLSFFISLSTRDPDPMVRAESILCLSKFPRKKVVVHLLNIMVSEKDRMVALKAEAILLAMPIKMLIKGLNRGLKDQNDRVRGKALLLIAEYMRESDHFFKYVLKRLKNTKSEKEKITLLEALGVVGSRAARLVLETYLHSSYLLAYTAMTSLTRIDATLPPENYLQYLNDPKLNMVLKQLVLKALVSKQKDPITHKGLIGHLVALLKSDNLNMRYLSIQALAFVPHESVLAPLFEVVLEETDPTSAQLLRESILSLLRANPTLFEQKLKKYIDKPRAVLLLLEILKMEGIEAKQMRDFILIILNAKQELVYSELNHAVADLLASVLSQSIITMNEFLEILLTHSQRGEWLNRVIMQLRNYPAFHYEIREDLALELLKEDDFLFITSLIELLGHSKGNQVLKPLIDILTRKDQAALWPCVQRALGGSLSIHD